jgi:hypothetical protein
MFKKLFVQGMKDSMPCTVCRKTCARLGVSAETALGYLTVRSTTEDTPKMFEFVNNVRCGLNILFHRILVVEEIASLDCIVEVLLPTVRFGVPQGGGNASLRCP